VVRDKRLVDEEYDSYWQAGPNGYGLDPAPREKLIGWMKSLGPAVDSFERAMGGRKPVDISELKPYINTPEQEFAFQKLSKIGVTLNAK
jgi:hypothetical protein